MRRPAVEGWFTIEPEPCLLGTRCRTCGVYFFPRETSFCRNPGCESAKLRGSSKPAPGDAPDFEEVPLSRHGRLWSYTDNRYAPPKPYVASDPFEPYAVAAVELEREKMVVLGQVVRGVGCDQLHVGMEMELAVETLYQDGDDDVLVWKWKPADARAQRGAQHDR